MARSSSTFKKGHALTPRQREAALENLRKWKGDIAGQSRAAHSRIAYENHEADKLKAAGFEVFYPTSVCDRVVVKDGKAYFVEFKKPGQELRAAQQRVMEAMPENYLVIETDFYASVAEI